MRRHAEDPAHRGGIKTEMGEGVMVTTRNLVVMPQVPVTSF